MRSYDISRHRLWLGTVLSSFNWQVRVLASWASVSLTHKVKLAHPDITSEERDTVAAKIWQVSDKISGVS